MYGLHYEHTDLIARLDKMHTKFEPELGRFKGPGLFKL